MTLVVGRIRRDSIAIVADTLLTEAGGKPLPLEKGVVKSVLVPGGLCVSFAGSPALAARDIWDFTTRYQNRWGFAEAVTHFEDSSRRRGVDYLLAFAQHPKLLKIVGGRRVDSISPTQWIGSKDAYEAFREREARARQRHFRGRALSGVLAANIGDNSAFDGLYETLREVIAERCCSTVGGFTSAVVRSGNGFIFPSFSDMLYDWPRGHDDAYDFQLSDRIDLSSSGENSEFSVAQFSTAYPDLSIVGFYFPHAGIAYVFMPPRTLIADHCEVIRQASPERIVGCLNEIAGLGGSWRLFVAVPKSVFEGDEDFRRSPVNGEGMAAAFKMLVNTFPLSGSNEAIPLLEIRLPGPDE